MYDDDKRMVELVRLIGQHFIARRDVKAVQGDDGAWMPVRQKDPSTGHQVYVPFTMMDFRLHFAGDRSLGHYLLDADNNVKLFAFDLDVMQPTESNGLRWHDDDGNEINPRGIWLAQDTSHPSYENIKMQLQFMGQALAFAIEEIFGGDVKVFACETGGKGLHVYGVHDLMPAVVARAAAHGVLESIGGFRPTRGDNFFVYEDGSGFDMVEIEMFPKQSELTDGGLGNLMALPFGVNRTTGNRRNLVSLVDDPADGERWAVLDPIDALSGRVGAV